MFHPVGWEDTIGGVGRPQEQINEDLKHCDYAVFVLHDRWGSPTGSGHTSGTEEEWALAEELYKATKIRNITLGTSKNRRFPSPCKSDSRLSRSERGRLAWDSLASSI